MAVSNALGSNTFNLCICLGLPWLLYPFVYGEPYEALHDYSVVVDVALLAFVLAVYVGVLVAYDYTLHAFMGYVFGLTWVAFSPARSCSAGDRRRREPSRAGTGDRIL
ncbi:calcium, potassium:sodium antiporter [Aureococcus anophagefferens]|nr:calcium, potassium:sodium antiporter [Aureococcus anophagefferens]